MVSGAARFDRYIGQAPLQRTAWIVGNLLQIALIAGCGESPPVTPGPKPQSEQIDVELPAVLTSELLAEGAPHRLQCSFVIRNDSAAPQQLEFQGTGCTCYGTLLAGRKLKSGELIDLPAGDALTFTVESDAPSGEREKELEAFFTRRSGEGTSAALVARCRLKVYADVRCDPDYLVCVLPPGETTLVRELLVSRCFRAPLAQSPPPLFESLPENVTLISIDPDGEPQRLDDELWRQSWRVQLQVTLTAQTGDDSGPRTVRLRFPPLPQHPPAVGTFQIAVQHDLPLRYPRSVHFGTLTVGETRTQKLFITSAQGRPFSLACDPQQLDAELVCDVITDREATGRHWIQLTLSPRATGELKRQLTLRTNLEEQPQITVQVTALVRGER